MRRGCHPVDSQRQLAVNGGLGNSASPLTCKRSNAKYAVATSEVEVRPLWVAAYLPTNSIHTGYVMLLPSPHILRCTS